MVTKKKVLVVDDEKDVVLYLRAALVNQGFEVRHAHDGDAGIALMVEWEPDLICLDVLMPGKTGMSFYHEIRGHPHWRRIPIVIVTGLSLEKELAPRLVGAIPPDGYVEKPIDLDAFLMTVRNILGITEQT